MHQCFVPQINGMAMMFHFTSGKEGHNYFEEQNQDSIGHFEEGQVKLESDKSRCNKVQPAYEDGGMTQSTLNIPENEEMEEDDLPERPSFTSNRPLVMSMLKQEQEMRTSAETQEKYNNQSEVWSEETGVPPYSIEDDIQKRVLRDHGITPTEHNVNLYRCINGLYRNDTEVRQLIMYMKHDRSRDSDLEVGDHWLDVDLLTLDQEKVKLSDFYTDRSKPFLVFAGSRS